MHRKVSVVSQSAVQFKLLEFARDSTSWGSSPILLLVTAIIIPQSQWIQIVLAYTITEIVTSCIKYFYPTSRPDEEKNVQKPILEKIHASSFPSIHTARSTVLTYFLFSMGAITWVVALVALGAVGVSRVVLKRHYPIDIVGGVVVALVVCLLLFR